MAVVRNLMIRAGADFSPADKQFKKFNTNMGNFQKRTDKQASGFTRTMGGFKTKIAGIMAGIAASLATVISLRGIADATKLAMQYEASLNQIGRTMKGNANAFQEWAKANASAFGMSQAEAVKYGAVYSNLISGFTSDTKLVQRYTEDLLKAAAITATGTGRTIEDAMDRIRSGMLGSTEAIEDLGINVNIAMIESTNAFKQFANGKSWTKLSFQTQQQIRLFAILEQATAKYGSEIANTTTAKQAMLTAELNNAKLALGQAFLPIYNAVLPALAKMAQALTTVTNRVATFIQAIFGKANVGKQTSEIEAQANAVTDLGNAYSKAGKKASKAVASFDQVNLLGGTTSSGADAGGLNGVSTGTEQAINELSNTVDSEVDKMREKLLNLITEENKEMIKKRVSDITESFNSLNASIANLKANPEFGKFLNNVAVWGTNNFADKIGAGMLYIDGTLKALDGTVRIINGLFSKDFEEALTGAELVVEGFADQLIGMVTFHFPGFGKKLEGFVDNWSKKWKEAKNEIKQFGDSSKLEVSDFGDYIKDKLSTRLSEIKTNFSNGFNEMKNNAVTKFEEMRNGITKKVSEIVAITVSPMKNSFSLVWDSISETATTKWKGIIGIVRNSVNTIIGLINKMIKGVNKFSIDVPDWVSKIPGVPKDMKSMGFNIPEIPKLAVGTNYVQRDGLAFLHEGEAVVPKKYNPAADGMSNQEVISALNRVEQAVRGLTQIKAYITQTEVGQASSNYTNNQTRRGLSPVRI